MFIALTPANHTKKPCKKYIMAMARVQGAREVDPHPIAFEWDKNTPGLYGWTQLCGNTERWKSVPPMFSCVLLIDY